jgi:hypothetical protein
VLTSSPAGYKNLGDIVEYDLDNDDEDWLAAYNGTQSRLPPERCAAVYRHAAGAQNLTRRDAAWS